MVHGSVTSRPFRKLRRTAQPTDQQIDMTADREVDLHFHDWIAWFMNAVSRILSLFIQQSTKTHKVFEKNAKKY